LGVATAFALNGNRVVLHAPPHARLSAVLRDDLGQIGVKVGCDAGDCGSCTVLIDGAVACACMTPLAQAEGRSVVTVEGVAKATRFGGALQRAFLLHGAVQCGACTPGMLISAAALLEHNAAPTKIEIEDALAGVLCRCTGYRKIIAAVRDAANGTEAMDPIRPEVGGAVGARLQRLDGMDKVTGLDKFGADAIPADALWVRAIRSPHHCAAFTLGDVEAFLRKQPGLVRVLTATDVTGRNLYGVLPAFADQPVFAEGRTRFRGEAIAAVVGERDAIETLELGQFPVTWTEFAPVMTIDQALTPGAPLLHDNRPGNVLIRGRVAKGNAGAALAGCDAVVEGVFETGFVEHAYIEPEAGWARRVGDRIEITASTQAPYLDREDTAAILGLPRESVRIIPSSCGGGFGSKLDLSVQPFVALAAWLTGRPAAMVYTRPESFASTTKRHPSRMVSRIGANQDGHLVAMEFLADFNTGAYASWGPTVANRVPVHASGPYVVPHYRAEAQAVLTNCLPAGAFRGFGVPQTVIAQEQLLDALALKIGMDTLEFRILNALRDDTPTVTGQTMGEGVGYRDCLEALRPAWRRARAESQAHNAQNGCLRRGAGVAGMFYGCGNTSMPNPSTIRIGLKPDGRIVLHQGAVDIGQGSNTVIAQIAADAIELPLSQIDLVSADTDLTPDCGKSSASRQTFITGKAAQLAGRALRVKMLRLANAGERARVDIQDGRMFIAESSVVREVELSLLPCDVRGYVLCAEETFDPPTLPLDADGQGSPYAVYGFGAHLAEVEVDLRLGTVRVLKVTAAHDVGRAINPTLIEGQIEGGVAQGIGLALMEEFVPGRGENLHDYLIPTIGDVPPIETILVERASSIGPYGAKGVGEQALIPTAPAILNAIRDATGVRVVRTPATPDRLRAAIIEAGRSR
jgi:aldehyde oxidoreductase